MSKKNNKNSQKQLKLEQQKQKNNYLNNLYEIFNKLGIPSAYKKIPPIDLGFLFEYRIRPPKILNNPEAKKPMPPIYMKVLNQFLHEFLHGKEFEFGPAKNNFSIYDIFSYLEIIYFYRMILLNKNEPDKKQLIEQLSFFEDTYEKILNQACNETSTYTASLSIVNSDFVHGIFIIRMVDPNTLTNCSVQLKCQRLFYASFEEPQTRILELDGHKRTIYRVGYYKNDHMEWIETNPDDFKNKGLLGINRYKIYIQIHLLERIKERINEKILEQNYSFILSTILDADVVQIGSNEYLFGVRINGIKIGYFESIATGDVLLLRTFLFITQNGTPEGKKLSKLLGINRDDKRFLSIDKMNTFVNSDIEENETIKKIFTDAGCGGLFELKKEIDSDPEHAFKCADYLNKYFNLKISAFDINQPPLRMNINNDTEGAEINQSTEVLR